MNAKQLFQDGKVLEAEQALSAWLRIRPEDRAARTFLFELLCFSGDWDRAERQLAALSEGSHETELGAMLYRSALHAERARHAIPDGTAQEESSTLSGTLNGRPFRSMTDADPAVGARLEIFVAGEPMRLAFDDIRSLRIEAPKRLRDTLWVPAEIETSGSLGEGRLGEALLPALYPFSWKSEREAVWLGRETTWEEVDGRERPLGQRILLVDGDEIPLLEVRHLEVALAQVAGHE